MELIGKTRNNYERDAAPALTINPQKGKLSFNKSAIKVTGLFDCSFGVAYDTNEDETLSVYLYEDAETGMPIPATGNVTNRYHARRIWDTLTDIDTYDANTTFELSVSNVPHFDERFPGISFYELTYAAKEIEVQSAVEEEAEVLAADSVQEVEELPQIDSSVFNLQSVSNAEL